VRSGWAEEKGELSGFGEDLADALAETGSTTDFRPSVGCHRGEPGDQ